MPISLPFFKKKEEPKYFLVLLLRGEKVHAVLLEELDGKIKILEKSQEFFQSSIEDTSEEELLTVLDKAITNVESTLPLDFPTHQTVFGVKENWVLDGKIKKQYLSKLKRICDELGLAPIGFLVIHEAIGHLMKKEEGAPVSTLLVETGKRSLIVSLIKAGRILETKSAPVKGSYAYTVDTLLKEFATSEILPSRITIFNDDKNEDVLMQEFIGHTWSKSLPFLHVPQITTLSKDFGIYAIITASAQQMGFEVLETENEVEIHQQLETAEVRKPAIESEKETEGYQPQNEVQSVKESQSLEREQAEEIEKGEQADNKEALYPKEDVFQKFGFYKDTDIAKISKEEVIPPEPMASQEESSAHKQSSNSFLYTAILILSKGKHVLSHTFHTHIKHRIKKPRISFTMPKGKFVLPVFITILLLLGAILLYIFGIKAIVTLTIEPKVIKQTQDVVFVNTSSDFSKNTIAADFITISEEGSVSETITGKREVGEKAKGSVTLYSRFTQDKTLPSDTTITSSNGLQFVFDDDTKLASASAGASTSPSTTKANVTAKQIGKESNLPSGTKFSVSSFDISDIEAKNDSAFSGGSKKEITAVSKNDLQKALDDLPKQLEQKAKEDLSKKVSKDQAILPSFISTTVGKKDFDKKEGEEAKSLILKGTVDYKAIAYKRSDFILYATRILSNSFPSNFSISQNNLKETVKSIKQKNGSEVLSTLEIQAFLVSKLDMENMKKNITGKTFLQAEDLLLKLPQVSDVRIILSPNVSFLPKFLPRISKNIEIRTKVND